MAYRNWYGAPAMGIWDKLKGELIDIIEWLDESQDTMVYRFERHNNEIKNGAQLIVRESQVAVLVDEGQFADVYLPGRHTLDTANMPILTTLRGWKYGFNSPFKVEVYFVSTKRFNDLKWGTLNPIMMRDPDFGMVRVRAFGTYAMRVVDPKVFLKEVAGTNWEFTADQISNQLRNYVVSGFADAMAETKMPVLDLYSKYDEMGAYLTGKVAEKVTAMGVQLFDLLVENVSLPPEVEQAIDTRSKMGAVGNMDQFMKFQAADAMVKGAENPGGMGGSGAQMAMGMMMAQQMSQGMQPGAPAGSPPPVPTLSYHVVVNGAAAGPFGAEQLQSLAASGQLTRETLVWKNGMAGWLAAGDQADLAGLFAAVPPPVPPQP
jgi:membrane protease subunit (stomatin/prohibitin family)